MRKAGLTLITLGFLGGSLAAVVEQDGVALAGFVPALLLGVVGVVLVQVGIRREAQDVSKREANFQILDESLTKIVADAKELDAKKEELDVYDLPDWIDARFREPILAFAAARESIAHSWGMQSYATVMSHFAAAERYLNRVWSTAADGYIDEAHTFATRSKEEFIHALEALESLTGGGEVPAAAVSGQETSTAAPT